MRGAAGTVLRSQGSSGKPFPLLSGRDWGSGNGPALAGNLGEVERAVWVEVDLGVGLREVRSSNLRMYRAGA